MKKDESWDCIHIKDPLTASGFRSAEGQKHATHKFVDFPKLYKSFLFFVRFISFLFLKQHDYVCLGFLSPPTQLGMRILMVASISTLWVTGVVTPF